MNFLSVEILKSVWTESKFVTEIRNPNRNYEEAACRTPTRASPGTTCISPGPSEEEADADDVRMRGGAAAMAGGGLGRAGAGAGKRWASAAKSRARRGRRGTRRRRAMIMMSFICSCRKKIGAELHIYLEKGM